MYLRRTNRESHWYELDFVAGCCWIPDLLVRHPRAILRDYRKPWDLINSTGLLSTRITVTYVYLTSNQGLRLTQTREMCGLSWLALSPVVYRESNPADRLFDHKSSVLTTPVLVFFGLQRVQWLSDIPSLPSAANT